MLIKSQTEEWKILKTESSPIFAHSFHTTFSQTQTDATVPLKGMAVIAIEGRPDHFFWQELHNYQRQGDKEMAPLLSSVDYYDADLVTFQ